MKTLILDGNNALWRLQMRLPELTANGKPVQVVYGFLRLLRSVITDFEPDLVLVCWDSGRSKYRREIYPEYKADRHKNKALKKEIFEQALIQLDSVKDILKYLNIAQLTFPDTEADDLIGIACHYLEGEKTIVSSDKDMLQLVCKEVSVWSPIKTQLYTRENFRELVGMTPKQWLEFRAITGDSSDNIHGVAKGLGEETAQELITRFHDIETLFKSSVESKVAKLGNRYALLYGEGVKERVYLNLLLMDLSLPVERQDYPKIVKVLKKSLHKRKKVDRMFLRDYFEEQKFKTLLKDFAVWILPFENLDVEES